MAAPYTSRVLCAVSLAFIANGMRPVNMAAVRRFLPGPNLGFLAALQSLYAAGLIAGTPHAIEPGEVA